MIVKDSVHHLSVDFPGCSMDFLWIFSDFLWIFMGFPLQDVSATQPVQRLVPHPRLQPFQRLVQRRGPGGPGA
jgi:hypothetical protein